MTSAMERTLREVERKLPTCEGCVFLGHPSFDEEVRLVDVLREAATLHGLEGARLVLRRLDIAGVRERCGAFMRALGRVEAERKRFGDALTWIERNTPHGVALVAKALSEVRK
jgi:hypothetical protein